jgi:hypothetical protein
MKGWIDCSLSQVSSVVCGVYIVLGGSETVTPAVCESLVWLVEVGEVEGNRRLGTSCDPNKRRWLGNARPFPSQPPLNHSYVYDTSHFHAGIKAQQLNPFV